MTTLPMDSNRAQEFFLFTTPLVAHFIAKATNQGLYLPLNKVGNTNSICDDSYVHGLNHLGINPYTMTQDNEPAFLEWIVEQVSTKYKAAELFITKKIIYRCPCGAIEMLSDATDKIEKRTNGKTFSITPLGTIECKKCKNIATSYSEHVLLTTPTKLQKERVQVQPLHYTPIVEEHLKSFIEKPQLISRARKTALQIDLDGNVVNIDNDFIWLHYGQYLQSHNIEIQGIVVSNHSVRKGAIYIYLTTEQDKTHTISLFVTPYIAFKDKSSDVEMNALANNYNPQTLRTFLLTHLNWQIQNTSADPNLLKWCAKISQKLPNSELKLNSLDNLDNIIPLIKGHAFKRLAQTILKNESLTNEQLKLLFILEPENHHF